MLLERYQQTMNERKVYSVDYLEWLDTGATLSSAEVLVAPSTAPAFAATAAIAPGGSQLLLTFSGGTAGTTYTVSFIITDTLGQKKEDCIQVVISSGGCS